jgi:riboflavin synthase
MFTGLIEDTGRVRGLRAVTDGARLTVETRLADELARGDSVSVNGVCLTVVVAAGGRFEADVVAETLRASTLGTLRPGAAVNLERALVLGDRIGGHVVTGHVDGVATVKDRRERGSGVELTLEMPEELVPEVVSKGSVAVDGTSLTVASSVGNRVTLALIPETLARTIARGYRAGTRVNVETDILAKHVRKLLTNASDDEREDRVEPDGAGRRGLTLERLRKLGF